MHNLSLYIRIVQQLMKLYESLVAFDEKINDVIKDYMCKVFSFCCDEVKNIE